MFFFGGVKFSEKVGNPLNIAAEYRRHSEDACRPCSAVMKCVKYLPWGLTHGYLCKGFLSEGRMYGCYYFTIAVTITMTITWSICVVFRLCLHIGATRSKLSSPEMHFSQLLCYV